MTQYDKSQGQFPKTGSSVTYNSESHNSQVRLLRGRTANRRLAQQHYWQCRDGSLRGNNRPKIKKSSATDRASKVSYPRMAFVEKRKDAMPGQMTTGSISHLLDSDKMPMANLGR